MNVDMLNKFACIFLLVTYPLLGNIWHDVELVAGIGYPSIVHATFIMYKDNWGGGCLVGYLPRSDREILTFGYRKFKQFKIGTGLYHRTFNENANLPNKVTIPLYLGYSFDSPFNFNSSIDLKTRIDLFQIEQPYKIEHSIGFYLSYSYRIKTSEWEL